MGASLSIHQGGQIVLLGWTIDDIWLAVLGLALPERFSLKQPAPVVQTDSMLLSITNQPLDPRISCHLTS